jgi:phosphopantetheinyl transferase
LIDACNFDAMPLIRKLSERGASIGVWYITERSDELIGLLQLDAGEKALIETLRHSKRYLHWLSSRVLLRQLLHTKRFIQLQSDANRKPVLVNFPHQLSISHSREMAAVIISEEYPVGIDVERIDTKVRRVRHKFLSPSELAALSNPDDIEQLITCWCAKEALYKYYGRGQVDFIADLRLDLPPQDKSHIAAHIAKDSNSDHIVHTMVIDDYMLAFVVGAA